MQPERFVTLDAAAPLRALTATARGMIEGNYIHAAQRAYAELLSAVGHAGRMAEVRSCIGLIPDAPEGLDDARCRYLAGVVFGHALATGAGACTEPPVPLSGSLAWCTLAPGRYAVFSHIGPYDGLGAAWQAVQEDWLPASGLAARAAPLLELSLTLPGAVPPERLHTELWLPVADR
jgi:AraC family transcriptional regulator